MLKLKKMNLPNKLTVLRIAMVPMFMVSLMITCIPCIYNNMAARISLYVVSGILFAAAAITDLIDGKIARKRNLITNFGKFMDPLADKFMVIGALLAAIFVFENQSLYLVISTAVIVFRELAISSIRLIAVNADNVVIAAAMPGKIKTVTQCIFMGLLILEAGVLGSYVPFFAIYSPVTYICMAVMVFFTIYSGVQYIVAYSKYIEQ